MTALTDSVKLNNGLTMPVLGLGTWNSKPGEVAAAVKHALKVGYRHIDGAAIYGNEKEVGEGIKAAMDEFKIKREEIFVVSKLWNTKHHPDDVEPACRKTLADLGLDYLDLYLIHWPQAYKRGDEGFPKNEDGTTQHDVTLTPTNTWLEMEKLLGKGLVKSIGVSNFNAAQIKDILDKGKITPVTNQVECHPYLNQDKLIEFCKKHNIVVTAYSPLGSPARPWAQKGDPDLLADEKLKEIGNVHKKTVAQILIHWQIQRGLVVIPKSVTPSRIEENANVFGFMLSEKEMEHMNTFNKGKEGRLVPVNGDKGHPHYAFDDDF